MGEEVVEGFPGRPTPLSTLHFPLSSRCVCLQTPSSVNVDTARLRQDGGFLFFSSPRSPSRAFYQRPIGESSSADDSQTKKIVRETKRGYRRVKCRLLFDPSVDGGYFV